MIIGLPPPIAVEREGGREGGMKTGSIVIGGVEPSHWDQLKKSYQAGI